MCNINILVRRRDANIDKEVAFMQTVTTLSYDSNNDADGVFFSDGLVMKSSDKLNLISLREHFVTSKMVMTHQRIATSGKEEQYHQPFTSEEFAFMHNGIVSSFATGGHSDTHNMFQTFLKYFNKNNAKNKSRQ
jgi:predicted glutamine amidotransferase